MKNIVIVGQGAIGFLWLYHWQKIAGIKVALRASSTSWQHKHEYSFSHVNGYSEQAHLDYADNDKIAQADLIIFCLKAYQILPAAKQLAPFISTSTPLVFCHNGMGVSEALNKLALANPILTLLTTHGCMKSTPLHAIHTGNGHSDIGYATSTHLSATSQQTLLNLFQSALPTVSWQPKIIEKQWLKLAINCVINPITALNNIANGEVNKAKYRSLIEKIIDEVIAAAIADGSVSAKFLAEEFTAKALINTVLNVADKTKNNCSSMRADILANRPTEIDHINGYIVQLAAKHKLNAKTNQLLTQQIKQRLNYAV
jgi:2-dehydropantoate 2-reductase